MYRRDFLVRTGRMMGGVVLASALRDAEVLASTQTPSESFSWNDVRSNFNLVPDVIHMSAFFLASHPKPVRDAIEEYRRELDANPIECFRKREEKAVSAVLGASAHYLGVDPGDIALTDSTTMGLGLLYGGLKLRMDQEILTTTHDHYATQESLRLRAERTGASIRTIPLYRDPAKTSVSEIVETVTRAVKPQTRVLAVTWVHSCTGVKLPLSAIADALKPVNANRNEQDRVLFCVDGLHGLGVDNVHMADLGCDFFISGCHKWLFGPRGTGLVWGNPSAWSAGTATIPTFDRATYQMWMGIRPPQSASVGATMSPGGFHSFEHRLALYKAFQFHEAIGRQRIQDRIHELNRQLKEGLAKMPNVKLYTPMSDELSAGIVCFDVRGLRADQVVEEFRKKKIVASLTPYKTWYARLAPSLLTSPTEVETTLAAVRELRT